MAVQLCLVFSLYVCKLAQSLWNRTKFRFPVEKSFIQRTKSVGIGTGTCTRVNESACKSIFHACSFDACWESVGEDECLCFHPKCEYCNGKSVNYAKFVFTRNLRDKSTKLPRMNKHKKCKIVIAHVTTTTK